MKKMALTFGFFLVLITNEAISQVTGIVQRKTITMEQENGEEKLTIQTSENGKESIEVYKGEEAKLKMAEIEKAELDQKKSRSEFSEEKVEVEEINGSKTIKIQRTIDNNPNKVTKPAKKQEIKRVGRVQTQTKN